MALHQASAQPGDVLRDALSAIDTRSSIRKSSPDPGISRVDARRVAGPRGLYARLHHMQFRTGLAMEPAPLSV